ncbi:hypothetical protein HYS94_01880 [Candidatus Daviesbacteria bacterium]|nr:hypothetical protein [Candidatus Daviesbacteria bacterium]
MNKQLINLDNSIENSDWIKKIKDNIGLEKQSEKSSPSELDALSMSIDVSTRKYLLELLDYKKQIKEQLKNSDNDVLYQRQLKDALEIIDNNINRIRFDGILD